MEKFLKTPSLPENKVLSVAVSGENKEIIHALVKLGIRVYPVNPNILLDKPLQSHADCNILHLGQNKFLTDFSQRHSFVNLLTNKVEISILKKRISSPYPDDIPINVKITDEFIICNSRYIAEELRYFIDVNRLKVIHVKQGYVGCSCVLINDHAAVSDDISICKALNSNGFDCLLVSKGSVKLDGYNYGFIGGCCGMTDKNTLTFTGNPETHSDASAIKAFLKKHNVKYNSLTDNQLIDVGGIIPLTELSI